MQQIGRYAPLFELDSNYKKQPKTAARLRFILFQGDNYEPTHSMGFAHRPIDSNLSHPGARYVFSSRQLSRRRKFLHSPFSQWSTGACTKGSAPVSRFCSSLPRTQMLFSRTCLLPHGLIKLIPAYMRRSKPAAMGFQAGTRKPQLRSGAISRPNCGPGSGGRSPSSYRFWSGSRAYIWGSFSARCDRGRAHRYAFPGAIRCA